MTRTGTGDLPVGKERNLKISYKIINVNSYIMFKYKNYTARSKNKFKKN